MDGLHGMSIHDGHRALRVSIRVNIRVCIRVCIRVYIGCLELQLHFV